MLISKRTYNLWNVDLIFNSHTHSGLIWLPFISGLHVPIQGFFLKIYTMEHINFSII